jgi:hypothetical protein
LVLRVQRSRQSESAGAVKLYFSKSNPLREDAASYVGTMLHEFAQAHLEPRNSAKPLDCILIDVFAEKIFVAPRATKKRQKELIDACEEIAAVWGSIREPRERREYRARQSKAAAIRVS